MNAKNATQDDRKALANVLRFMSIMEEQMSRRLPELGIAGATVSKWHPAASIVQFGIRVGSPVSYSRIDRLVKLGFLQEQLSDGSGREIKSAAG
jgi:hypothetical protein